MSRAANLFAGASAALVILGLLLSKFFATRQLMSVTWPGSKATHVIGCEVPCYGLAGLFALFACAYALSWIRLSEAIMAWHLWMSLSGVALFGLGFALLGHVAARNAVRGPSQGALLAVAIGMFVGPMFFLAGQLIFVVALIRVSAGPRY